MPTRKKRHRRIKKGVYVKVFTEGMDLRRWQGLLLYVDIVPALQKEGNKECHRLIALVLPDNLDDVGNKLIRSRDILNFA